MPACEVCGSDRFRHLFRKDGHEFYRCRSCQLVRIQPQPTDEVLGNIYGGKYFDSWGVQHDAERVLALKKATFQKHVLSTVSLPPHARVLDCGAAFGTLMDAAKAAGWEPYGIELAADAAAEIAERFGREHVFAGPFEAAVFPQLGAASFDALFMCDFIEHVRDPVSVLKKAASLLRVGGNLVLTTPDGGSLSCRTMGASWPHYKIEHLFYFNRANAPALLDKAGIKMERVGAAKKILSFEYVQRQFNAYPRAVLTPVLNLLGRISPTSSQSKPRSFSFGEMIVVGKRDDRGQAEFTLWPPP